MKSFDAVIVGGGHNGLVTAFYLARAGLSVVVLERRPVVGGPVATVEFFPGYRGAFTNSPGSFEPRIVADMELGRFGLRWVKPDPSVLMPFPGGRFFVGWRDQARTRENIAKTFSRRDADAYAAVFEFFNDFARRIKVSVFEPPPSLAELTARLRTPQDEADFGTIFFGSIREFLEQRLESDEMRAVIAMMAGSGAVSPSTPGTPVHLLARPMSLYSYMIEQVEHDPRNQPLRGSTGLPLGGMGSITEAMGRSLEARGVTIKVNSAVARIMVGADGATRGAVLADGTEIKAPIVVSNLHPRTTLLDLLETGHLPDDIGGRLNTIPSGGAVFKVVLAVDEPPLFAGAPEEDAVAYASCQFRIAPGMAYLERCYEDYRAGRSTHCPRLWGLTPTFTDPTMAPPGKHLVSVNAWFFPYHLAEGSWETEREVVGRRIVDLLSEYIPSLRRSVVATKFYSPLDIEREFGLLEGNFSHIDMTPQHGFSLRPVAGLAHYRTPVHGLYLCGSGTWPGGTVTGVPGFNAGHQVLRDLARQRGAAPGAPLQPDTLERQS